LKNLALKSVVAGCTDWVIVLFLHFTVMVILCFCVFVKNRFFIAGPGYINTREKIEQADFFLLDQ